MELKSDETEHFHFLLIPLGTPAQAVIYDPVKGRMTESVAEAKEQNNNDANS